MIALRLTLREKYPNTKFFSGPYFPVIWTEYRDLLRKSPNPPYSVRIQEKYGPEKSSYWTLFTQYHP